MLVARLLPTFLLQQSPDFPRPAISFIFRLPATAAFHVAAVSWSPFQGGHPDPIPILKKTQILLI